MGVVYQARHVKLNRPAALKMVLGDARAESKEIIRFLAEAEAVAAIDHPHVVRVYEFGEADGRPFLALELCPGGSLADRLYAAGRLDPAAAAELVRKLAAGVAAAHALGIVHRDLKPGNVLFDDRGEPKVSDFGLAKKGAGAGVTLAGAVMGTPAYMSPEQAKGESKFVGPQADVWALGVILYECLTADRPFKGGTREELLAAIISADPAPPRRAAPGVPRDLDLICRKCLAKEPHDRYPAAGELADDLGRFLAGKPTLARPAALVERGWKWARRNKPAVTVILALAALAGIATWQAVRAETEAVRANDEATRAGTEATNARLAEAKAVEREGREKAAKEDEKKARETAEEVARFMREVFTQTSAHGQASPTRKVDPNLTVLGAMTHATKALEGRFPDRPQIEAAVRLTLGQTFQELGRFPEAEEQFRLAVAGYEKTLGPDHPETLKGVGNLAGLYSEKGNHPAAELLYKRALAGQEAVLGPDHPDTLTSVHNLAALYRETGDIAAAGPLFRRALDGYEKVYGPDHPDTLTSVSNLAGLYYAAGDYPAAEPLFRRALAGQEKALGPDHPDTLLSANNLAGLYDETGRYPAAEPLYRRALAGQEQVLGPDHPDTLTTVANLAELYAAMKRYADAVPLLERAVVEYAKRPEMAGAVPSLRGLLGLSLLASGKPAVAEPHLLAGYDGLAKRKALGPRGRTRLWHTAQGLAEVYDSTNRPAEAAAWRAKLAALPPEVAPRPRPAK
jgi:tetratricopeptide (TPR) repeat protein